MSLNYIYIFFIVISFKYKKSIKISIINIETKCLKMKKNLKLMRIPMKL